MSGSLTSGGVFCSYWSSYGSAERRAGPRHRALHQPWQLVTEVGAEGTNRSAQRGGIRDHVPRIRRHCREPTEITGRLQRRYIPRDDALQRNHDLASDQGRIDRLVRDRSVAAACPRTVMVKSATEAICGPSTTPTVPLGIPSQMWSPSAASTPSSTPASITRRAPAPISSAG